jgi:hypothetical protein
MTVEERAIEDVTLIRIGGRVTVSEGAGVQGDFGNRRGRAHEAADRFR